MIENNGRSAEIVTTAIR